METAPKAGKSWQPSHEPPYGKGKQAPVTLNKQKEGRNCPDDELSLQIINTESSSSKHIQEFLK